MMFPFVDAILAYFTNKRDIILAHIGGKLINEILKIMLMKDEFIAAIISFWIKIDINNQCMDIEIQIRINFEVVFGQVARWIHLHDMQIHFLSQVI